MPRLEDISVGSQVNGIAAGEPVTVIAMQWYGDAAVEVTFKNSKGQLANQILYRDDENQLEILENHLPWSFDANADRMRLVSEAYRINLAHIFDPYLAVHTSSIEPLPHQISAVYQEMLPRLPLRYILADDPGAGKTIMTGLFIKELIVRGDLKRCLIVTPGNLSEQWQDELYRKFHLRFEILTNDRIESAVSGNIFTEMPFCIARLDKLARNEALQEKLKITDWDLIVCDEAHKMSATVWGGEIKYTKRFNLGRLLSEITRNLLLLTATPHNGKNEDFQLFLSLIDPDRFEGASRSSNRAVDVSDVMRRLVKEELLKFDGTPLFPERRAYTVNYYLSPLEAQLYNEVTDYVREEFNRADKLNNERKTTVGFALTILQRRLASSPEAIYQSLRRRRERLEHILAEEKMGRRGEEYSQKFALSAGDDFDEDDYTASELEVAEENVADRASAANTISEMEAEIRILKHLEQMANTVRASGEDRKWDELSRLLQDEKNMFSPEGQREKLIIFTEHRDTLRYLTDKIRNLFGSDEAVVTIHGGMLRDERRKVEELFKQDKEVRILIATDAAGEGINLQRAHLMVNYDLPWNPNRLEQRFGRIHRIGQTEVCHLWNLVSRETREGMVFQRLFEKLEEEREALGGKVFDILGKMTFDNRPLRDLLIEAVRYGNDPEVRARLWQVVDNSMDREKLRDLLEERALTEDTMDVHRIAQIIPQHFAQVRQRKQQMLDKITKAVKERLTAEIQYWDFRAADLKQKEAAGKINARLNSQMAARRAEDLAARMQKRLAELDKERMLSPAPPIVTGGALIIPRGLLIRLTGGTPTTSFFGGADKKAVELAAMNAVLAIEQQLGYQPKDVSADKIGYDIESIIPPALRTGSQTLRFIEVKGRAKGATTVTVSKNEILTGLNKPEKFILAVVEVDGSTTHTTYLKHPFRNAPDFTATSVNYDLSELTRHAEILLQQ